MAHSSALYAALKDALTRSIQDFEPDRHPGILTFPSRAFDEATATLLANLERSGYCTLVVASPDGWNPCAPYYEQVRDAARRGCAIERVFLLSHRHARHNPSLAEHVRLDTQAGIRATVINIGDLLAKDKLTSTDRLEVGLWDDEITCVAVTGTAASGQQFTEWRVSRRLEDKEYVRELRAQLLEGELIDLGREEDALHLEEPMISSASLAMRLAPVLCGGDHVDESSCEWYHGIWQFLRVFDMVSTPTWHGQFYVDALRGCAERGARTVLITGTADYSMYAHVLHAFRRAGYEPQVTVLDLCETPLMLCRWYGRLVGHEPRIARSDVLSFDTGDAYDVVVTDAFITRFTAGQRHRVAEAWARYLGEHGSLITTIRVEPGTAGGVLPTAAQVERFTRRARQSADRWRAFLLTDPADIESAARTYAGRMVSNAFAGLAEVNDVLGGHFELTRHVVDVPGELKATTYAEVIGVKRS